uniref:Uncharacterized protein n=1 Tax=Leersia perrieri TaxID=77586 RepID=A0A0D9VSN3_9ORYZ
MADVRAIIRRHFPVVPNPKGGAVPEDISPSGGSYPCAGERSPDSESHMSSSMFVSSSFPNSDSD